LAEKVKGKQRPKHDVAKLRTLSLEQLVRIAEQEWKRPPSGFIKSIRFPHYRNMEPDARLDFEFPVSVFTGPNGCGKSSVLLALYGAPEGYSVGRYWFSTDVDPIGDSPDGRRPSLVYEYVDASGQVLVPIKTRIRKRFPLALLKALGREKSADENKVYDPNYWEPSRPLAWAGLPARSDRDPTVNRHVIYLHFRTQLSAFESAFYGSGPPTTERREYLRRKSRHLLRAFSGFQPLKPRGRQQSRPLQEIKGEAIEEVNEVVGKKYIGALIVEHKLFGVDWGQSVRFQLQDATYSDAFAGSGESAILRLILALQQAPEGALVILDEPEISLHPEAQHRMKRILLVYAIYKRLQIFLATHSSHFVDGFPERAIFVFQRGTSGKFSARNTTADLAMVSIGHRLHPKCILVEDRLAKRMVERVLSGLDAAAPSIFDIRVVPGGASAVFASLAHDPTQGLLAVLDGDQRPTPAALDAVQALLEKRDVPRDEWDRALAGVTKNQTPKFFHSGNSATGRAKDEEAICVRRLFAEAILARTKYLPGTRGPEDLLVTTEGLRQFYTAASKTPPPDSTLTQYPDGKAAIYATAQTLEVQYESLLDFLLARWSQEKAQNYVDLEAELRKILTS
jgi:predicted ATPase